MPHKFDDTDRNRRRPAMTVLDFTPLTREKWLNLHRIDYLDGTGRRKTWQLASRDAVPKAVSGRFAPPDAVVIVARHAGFDKLVVTREFRIALGDFEYGFPAGLIDEGETAEEAAGRELREETGLQVTRILRLGPPVYSSAGMTDESVAMIYVECRGEIDTTGNQASEVIDVLLVSPSEAAALIDDPRLKFDAKAWLTLNHYAAAGKMPS